ncbi:MAG: hypothetical protein ABI859_20150 [Pseudomonadota bacterium]
MEKNLLASLLALTAAAALSACTTNAPPTTSAKSVAAAEATALTTLAQRRGYKRVTRDGKELYCQREVMTGSRTSASETCLTEEQLALQVQKNQDFLRQWQNLPGKQVEPANGRMIDATTIR